MDCRTGSGLRSVTQRSVRYSRDMEGSKDRQQRTLLAVFGTPGRGEVGRAPPTSRDDLPDVVRPLAEPIRDLLRPLEIVLGALLLCYT